MKKLLFILFALVSITATAQPTYNAAPFNANHYSFPNYLTLGQGLRLPNRLPNWTPTNAGWIQYSNNLIYYYNGSQWLYNVSSADTNWQKILNNTYGNDRFVQISNATWQSLINNTYGNDRFVQTSNATWQSLLNNTYLNSSVNVANTRLAINAYNGLDYDSISGLMKLGGFLTENTQLASNDKQFQVYSNLNITNGQVKRASNFVASLNQNAITHDSNTITASTLSELALNNSGTNTIAKYSIISADMASLVKKGTGNYTGDGMIASHASGSFFTNDIGGTGRVRNHAGYYYFAPRQISPEDGGIPFSDTIDNEYGWFIEDIGASPLASRIKNKMGIFQQGINDSTIFNSSRIKTPNIPSGTGVNSIQVDANGNWVKGGVSGGSTSRFGVSGEDATATQERIFNAGENDFTINSTSGNSTITLNNSGNGNAIFANTALGLGARIIGGDGGAIIETSGLNKNGLTVGSYNGGTGLTVNTFNNRVGIFQSNQTDSIGLTEILDIRKQATKTRTGGGAYIGYTFLNSGEAGTNNIQSGRIVNKLTSGTIPVNPHTNFEFWNMLNGTLSKKMSIEGDGKIIISIITEHTDNAAATAAGLAVGTLYRTGDLLKIVH